MKRRNFVRLSGIGAGALMTGLYGCEKIVPSPEDPEIIPGELIYGNFKKKILSSGIECPSGISLYESGKKSMLKASSLEELVFCSGPLLNSTQSKFMIKPYIFNYQGEENNINVLYEFGEEDLDLFKVVGMDPVLDEMGNPVLVEGESIWRPLGVNSDTAIMNNSTILFSTMMSNKIFDLTGGVKKNYLENDDLIGINNMIYGIDDKIYLTQVAVRDSEGQIIRPKRVVSLDSNKNLNIELELPDEGNVSWIEPIMGENSLYRGKYLETGSQIRIVENLDQRLDPSRFFIMDQYSRSIYKVSEEGNLENLLSNASPEVYPSGLAAEINGKIYYITSPIMYHPSNPNLITGKLAFDPQLRVVDPKKRSDSLFYTFEGIESKTYSSGRSYVSEIEFNEGKYLLPINFLMTLGAVQVDNNLNIYYTDNIAGDFGELSATAK